MRLQRITIEQIVSKYSMECDPEAKKHGLISAKRRLGEKLALLEGHHLINTVVIWEEGHKMPNNKFPPGLIELHPRWRLECRVVPLDLILENIDLTTPNVDLDKLASFAKFLVQEVK